MESTQGTSSPAIEDTNTVAEKVRCTNCKCWRTTDQYVGSKGVPVKRCKKCRDKDSKQKKRPEVVVKNKKRQNEKKYYVKYREKRRENDEQAYLKHNAEVAQKWRENNKEHVIAKARFRTIKSQAQKDGVVWSEDLTDEMCYTMMTSPCFYCNFISDATPNEIVRMDASGSYETSNIVSCCTSCKKSIFKRQKETTQQPRATQRSYTKGSNLPDDCAVNAADIPKYCYYIQADDKTGDGFVCSKHHPRNANTNKDWRTTRKRTVSTLNKFNSLLAYISTTAV